ncbi:NAD(P)H-dependent oxidoreductase [Streptomyces coelicoflavus]|uniref:NAD(P)H-dependent oxidoreductase n=1 Tax=Streptomyces coelicoflavus TaxID=285562 RepID=A0A7K3PMT7_9ACTN|nr:NAD(P)H-dependent oxidoreductase [Streptomyces coelicoflavus]NEB11270.1 NAD(P)H-dependent oxidoreductase [Streptomyces coelicoflavus]
MSVRLVALGGSIGQPGRPSRTESALRRAAAAAVGAGAEVEFFVGEQLRLPLYDPSSAVRDVKARQLVEAVRRADALLIASPAYHGAVSGLIKNALDYFEDLREDVRPYLEQRVVGCIGVGAGPQGPAATLRGLRDIVHALRGWPTPLGVVIGGAPADLSGGPDDRTVDQLESMGTEVADFARTRAPARSLLG